MAHAFFCRGVPDHTVYPWGLAAVVVRHSFHGKRFAAERVGQQMLQGMHLAPSSGLHCLHDTRLEPPHLSGGRRTNRWRARPQGGRRVHQSVSSLPSSAFSPVEVGQALW